MVRNSQNFWSLGLLVLSGLLFFIAENNGSLSSSSSGKSEQASLAPSNLDQRLNDHLMETAETLKLNDELRELESHRPPKIGQLLIQTNGFSSAPVAPVNPGTGTKGLGLTDETMEDAVFRRLHEHDPKISSALTPGDIVSLEVQQKEQERRNKRQLEQARKDLVRQYIANAKKMGYAVTVNKDYVVERVERLPNSAPDAGFGPNLNEAPSTPNR